MTIPPAPLVHAEHPEDELLARQLGLDLLDAAAALRHLPEDQLVIGRDHGRLCLRRGGAGGPGPVAVDFESAAMRHRRKGGQNELVGRALGVKGSRFPAVLDATAGLGRDAFVLADLGCRVWMCERHPVMQALLRDGLERAGASEHLVADGPVSRLQLVPGAAEHCTASTLVAIDVIYLDPMFPGRTKQAAVKKDLAMMQLLLGEPRDGEAGQLLNWALGQTVNRVVVKRPPRAAPVSGVDPSHEISGKAVRYDVYMLNRKSLD